MFVILIWEYYATLVFKKDFLKIHDLIVTSANRINSRIIFYFGAYKCIEKVELKV